MNDHEIGVMAKTLARWCYERGIDEQIRQASALTLSTALEQALARQLEPHLATYVWALAAELLLRRRDWDRTHRITPPPAAACISCAVSPPLCLRHGAPRCRVCSGPMHPVNLADGFATHPTCEHQPGSMSQIDLDRIAAMLGGTYLDG